MLLKTPEKRTCPRCGKEFFTKYGNQIYCSYPCRIGNKGNRICVKCGRHTTLRNLKGEYECSFCREKEQKMLAEKKEANERKLSLSPLQACQECGTKIHRETFEKHNGKCWRCNKKAKEKDQD